MASDKIVQVSDADFDEKVLKNSLPVVVDFWAEWCGPCRMVAPILDQLAEEVHQKAVVAKMNVDENKKTPAQFNINAIPTMIFFKNGKETARIVGAGSKNEIKAKMDQML